MDEDSLKEITEAKVTKIAETLEMPEALETSRTQEKLEAQELSESTELSLTEYINGHKDPIKRNIKDSVFTKLFSELENIKEMYKFLHEENTNYAAQDFEILTINNVIANGVYNDLCFMFKEKLIVLVEAQSTLNYNMAIRMLVYYAKILHSYIKMKKLDIYSKKRIKLPNPEFYMIYTGQEKVDGKEMKLSDLFLDKTGDILELKVNVITEEDALSKVGLVKEYIEFTRILDKFRSEYPKDLQKTVQCTIEYCIENNILKEFMNKNKLEVADMLITLYDQKEIDEMRAESLLQEGIEKGIEKGIAKGIEKGIEKGEEKKVYEVVKSMLSEGFDFKTISRITKISESDFKKIQSAM